MKRNDLIEYYHSTGQLPDIYYYQLNGKSAEENFTELMKKRSGRYDKNKSFLENYIINVLRASLDKTLKELLDNIIPTK